jgi:hypothetical protein
MLTVDDVKAEIIRRYLELDELERNSSNAVECLRLFAAVQALERIEWWIDEKQAEVQEPKAEI